MGGHLAVAPGHTWSHLVTPYHTWSHLTVAPGYTWPDKVTPDHTWSHLATPGHTGHTWLFTLTHHLCMCVCVVCVWGGLLFTPGVCRWVDDNFTTVVNKMDFRTWCGYMDQV